MKKDFSFRKWSLSGSSVIDGIRIFGITLLFAGVLFVGDLHASNCSKYFGKGYCVDYIEKKAGHKQSGNASQWSGKKVSEMKNDNKKGDVAIFPEAAGGYGHVAYIEKVNKDKKGNVDSIEVSEWNYGPKMVDKDCAVTNKFGEKTTRTVKIETVGRIWRP